LESELFGHEAGAFTGAKARRLGRFELAHQGTIFLDEIGDMKVALQKKLLRVLQEGTIERVGGSEPIPVDVRVLAATHRDLEAAMREEQFRQDLFFRLNVELISLPPLRDRQEDIPELARYFIEKYGPELGASLSGEMREALKSAVASFFDTRSEPLTPLATAYVQTIKYLRKQNWPGNVRELRNVIRKSLLLAGRYPVTVDIVHKAFDQMKPPPPKLNEPFSAHVARVLPVLRDEEREDVLADLLEVVERELFTQTMRRTAGDQTKAARWLGVTRPTVREKLNRLHIRVAR
jgi:transcriptional regulator with GAF, ATPase, and Fis domain